MAVTLTVPTTHRMNLVSSFASSVRTHAAASSQEERLT